MSSIDDPVKALISLNASDERQRSVMLDIGPYLARIIGLFASPETKIASQVLGGAINWFDRKPASNLKELVNEMAAEMVVRGAKIDQLIASDERHKRFIADELPGLVFDAVHRAQRVRAKERIQWLGRILVHAAEIGSAEGAADYAEEMMRIAVDLSGRDLELLIDLRNTQGALDTRGVIQREQVNEAWRDHPPRLPGMSENEIQSICGKLQSFGLVARIERNNFKLGPSEIPYALLHKGKDFLMYIQSSIS